MNWQFRKKKKEAGFNPFFLISKYAKLFYEKKNRSYCLRIRDGNLGLNRFAFGGAVLVLRGGGDCGILGTGETDFYDSRDLFYLRASYRQFFECFGVSHQHRRNCFGALFLPQMQKTNLLVRQRAAFEFHFASRQMPELQKKDFLAISADGTVHGRDIRGNRREVF